MGSKFEDMPCVRPIGSAHAGRRAIRIIQYYDDPPGRVFAAWIDPDDARRWLFATALRPMTRVEIDAREGGLFLFADRIFGRSVEYMGRYVRIVRGRHLTFDLRMPDSQDSTRVVVEFRSHENRCELALAHFDVPPERVDDVEARWVGILYGLGETLEAGRNVELASGAPVS